MSDTKDRGSPSEYTHLWEHEMRGGYGYIERVPCRLLGTTASGKRMKIAALRADGTEQVRYVKPERVSRDYRASQ